MKKISIAISIGLNVLFVVIAIGMFAAVYSGYFIKLFIQPAHERWVSQFEELPISIGDTVFLGDSITEGGSWHELFPSASVRNRGIGGDVTSGVLARLDQIRHGLPGQVFLLIGTNDIAFGVSEADIVKNVEQIVANIHSASPQTEVLVQSVLPRAIEYKAQIESLNHALESAVAGTATWVDLYPLFIDADGSIKNEYSNDELHLHGAGYIAWRDKIRPLVAMAENVAPPSLGMPSL